jgi:hypothetical protein
MVRRGAVVFFQKKKNILKKILGGKARAHATTAARTQWTKKQPTPLNVQHFLQPPSFFALLLQHMVRSQSRQVHSLSLFLFF